MSDISESKATLVCGINVAQLKTETPEVVSPLPPEKRTAGEYKNLASERLMIEMPVCFGSTSLQGEETVGTANRYKNNLCLCILFQQ